MLVNYAPSDRVSAAANCMPDVSNEALKEHVNAIGMPLGGGSGIGTHR